MFKSYGMKKKALLFLISGGIALLAAITAFLLLRPSADNAEQLSLLQEYQVLQDSLTSTEIAIRESKTPELRSLQKDRLALFQKRLQSLRKKLPAQVAKPETPMEPVQTVQPKGENAGAVKENSEIISPPIQTIPETPTEPAPRNEMEEWIKMLLFVIVGTALVLLLVVAFLFYRLKQKTTSSTTSSTKSQNSETGPIHFNLPTQEKASQSLQIPEPIKVDRKDGPKKDQKLSEQMAELEAFFNQKNAQDYSNQFGHTAELEALYPKVAEKKPAPAPESPKEIYPSTLKRIEKEDKEKSDILKLARRGYTSSDIARRLRISQDQVELFLRMHRDSQ